MNADNTTVARGTPGDETPIVVVDAGDSERAAEIAHRLGVPVVDDRLGVRVALRVAPAGLSLALPTDITVTADFIGGRVARRGHRVHSEALIRAIGVDRGVSSVIDATAGLGRDAFLLATAGCEVCAFERHPVVALLFRDALARAERHAAVRATAARIAFTEGDAIDALAQSRADAVYLDPMFPARGKAALAKKDAQSLQALVGPAADVDMLFEAALGAARRRVVVKRPRTAPPLAERVSHAITGRSVRFDVYRKG